jgi:NAD-dependent dihydropyrimidine dehydrogenase PreA subunit
MSRLRELALDVLQTAFRLVPWPTEAGLRRVGSPGPSSPVVVTGNYDLTVRRLLRALRGLDAWVVVAPSAGINVWCAAAGGHLTTHQVVTALKTSGIDEYVTTRRAILPQLAATGVIARDVSRRCGWKVRFGPVYAQDLPRYLAADGKTDDMRHVRFDLAERLEMAASWGAPSALVVGAVAAIIRWSWALPCALLALVLAAIVFLVYDRLPRPRRLWLATGAVALAVGAVWSQGGGTSAMAAAAIASTALSAVLTFDYTGSTPIEGSSLFDERHWQITLDTDRCAGVYNCWEVCPKACFEKRADVRKIDLAHDDRCIRCGACIVQCPMDALYFEDQNGARVEPETIRRFKLNLLGKRTVRAGVGEDQQA